MEMCRAYRKFSYASDESSIIDFNEVLYNKTTPSDTIQLEGVH
jgi:hypothetical protein